MGRKRGAVGPECLIQSLLLSLENEATNEYIEDCEADSGSQLQDGLPEWFDQERFRRGTKVFERNIFIMFTSKMSGLLTLLAIPSIVKVLVLTKQSGEPHRAFRRYVDTIRHMLFWYRSSVTDPKSRARESLQIVRRHHMRGAAAARKTGLPGISQFDLAITQFAFCGYAVLRRKRLRLDASDHDVLDFLHVWRTLGFLIGIRDQYNLGQFDQDMAATDKLFHAVCVKWLAPALASPPHEFHHMSLALLDGAWCIMPILEYGSYLHFTQELAGVPPSQRYQPHTYYSSMVLSLLHMVPASFDWPILGSIFKAYHNLNMRFSLFMSTYYPLLAWYSFPGNRSTHYHKLVSGEHEINK